MPSKWLSLLKGQKSVNYVLRGITFQYSFFLLLFFISFQSIFLPLFTSNSQPLRCFSDSLYLLIHLDSLSLSPHTAVHIFTLTLSVQLCKDCGILSFTLVNLLSYTFLNSYFPILWLYISFNTYSFVLLGLHLFFFLCHYLSSRLPYSLFYLLVSLSYTSPHLAILNIYSYLTQL